MLALNFKWHLAQGPGVGTSISAGVASAQFVRVGLPAGTWLAVEIYLRKHNLHESGPVSRFYAVSSTEASASANVVD